MAYFKVGDLVTCAICSCGRCSGAFYVYRVEAVYADTWVRLVAFPKRLPSGGFRLCMRRAYSQQTLLFGARLLTPEERSEYDQVERMAFLGAST